MARNTLEAWLPEDYDSTVIQRLAQTSVAETSLKSMPMSTETKSVPRSAGMGVEVVPKGGTYGEDESLNDDVVLTVRKFGKALRIAEEDIDDSIADILTAKKTDWATSFGILLDNAVFAVTAATNGGTVPFTSIYKALSTTNAATGYTANANKLATAGALTYDDISDLASLVEVGGFHDSSRALFVAHPSVMGAIRKLQDGNGEYIFTANPRQGDPDTLFGYPIKFSNGLKTSATALSAPGGAGGVAGVAGNALIAFGNTDFAYVGKRSGPESVVIDGRSGLSALSDETILKVRARRAAAIAHEKAWAILEISTAS
jgi:HK97 family phage major capsid protein